jgi:hypothetical protein
MTESEQRELQREARNRLALYKKYFNAQIHGVIYKKQPLTEQDIEQLKIFIETPRQELNNTIFFGNITVKNCTTDRKVLDLNTKKWKSYKY